MSTDLNAPESVDLPPSEGHPLAEQPLSEQPMSDRGANRTLRPESAAFTTFMAGGWAPEPERTPARAEVASYAAARRRAISGQFPGERLIIPAGPLKVRSNDTDYRFRPHSAFAHLTGFGTDHEPGAVLVLEPVADGGQDSDIEDGGSGHHATLYFRQSSGRDSKEFYANARFGEFWIGPRITAQQVQSTLGLDCADLADLELALTRDAGVAQLGGMSMRLVREVDLDVDALVDTSRINTGVALDQADTLDARLSEALSELRLMKDGWEIHQLRTAVAATVHGFHDVVRSLPRAITHPRGERVVEGAFHARAREEGNDLGYDTIAASGNNATILHWIRNDGQVRPGELLLLDAGVEADSLYTADVTRTLPVNGKFSPVQLRVYQAVLDAADAGFAAARPGRRFRDVHQAAVEVLAGRLHEWGLLPVSLAEALSEDGQQHRRWMPHGTSHHLGLDVHDCAQARRELYLDAELQPGMVFTIEPGLYFKDEDLAIPAEYRGIGVRIEDDILMTADGPENLSAALPRTPEDVESWMAGIYRAEEGATPPGAGQP